MKITDMRAIVTCPARQTYALVKIMTGQGVYGVGEGTKSRPRFRRRRTYQPATRRADSEHARVRVDGGWEFGVGG